MRFSEKNKRNPIIAKTNKERYNSLSALPISQISPTIKFLKTLYNRIHCPNSFEVNKVTFYPISDFLLESLVHQVV